MPRYHMRHDETVKTEAKSSMYDSLKISQRKLNINFIG